MSIENKKWKDFLIGDIFNIKTGALLPKKILKKGNVARITATDSNNGVYDYYSEVTHKNFRTVENFISVSFLGSVFYHPYLASLDMKIHSVQLKNIEFNRHIAHFMVIALKRTTAIFSYGDQLSSSDLPKKKILLPVNDKDEPDFDFMQSYIKTLEQNKISNYNNYIKKRIENLQGLKKIESIDKKEWIEFYIQDIFKPTKGDQNKMSSLLKGDIPLISAKNGNNGSKAFVSLNNKKMYPKESLTLNNDGDGGAGFSFYQPFDYLLDSHVTSLSPINKMSKYSLLFISRCITKQRNRFGHGYAINNNRLKAFKIMLPIDSKGKPDFPFMENFMKQLEYKKLSEYLEFKNN